MRHFARGHLRDAAPARPPSPAQERRYLAVFLQALSDAFLDTPPGRAVRRPDHVAELLKTAPDDWARQSAAGVTSDALYWFLSKAIADFRVFEETPGR